MLYIGTLIANFTINQKQLKVKITMLKFINKLFKKEIAFSYTIAEYQPIRINQLQVDVIFTNLQLTREVNHDEMQIDHLYEKN